MEDATAAAEDTVSPRSPGGPRAFQPAVPSQRHGPSAFVTVSHRVIALLEPGEVVKRMDAVPWGGERAGGRRQRWLLI